MKMRLANNIALLMALREQQVPMPNLKTKQVPKEKTSSELYRMTKAEEKRKRKAAKRLAEI